MRVPLFLAFVVCAQAGERHWAFETPVKAPVPSLADWGSNEIDGFIHRKLAAVGLSPQAPTPREEFIRRASIDLTGIPPTLNEIDAFLTDEDEGAFGRVVDRLLASPRFGERWAAWWMDAARYGDSHGYDNDLENSQWPWRNWVIEAFNANMPFDQFTVEQLAGDLLPGASESQILATGFNRNHRIQTEGGAIDEEWRTEYVMDRVETAGTVWMGLTLGCARCHDHPYDPITQREFYQLFALFNKLDEKGFINNLRGSAEPRIRYKAAAYAAGHVRAEEIEDEGKRKEFLAQIEAGHPQVMVMRDMETPRTTFLLERGQYDAPTEEVRPGLPEFLRGPKGEVTRLAMARWLVDGRHPLTARVLVNRLWEQLFGNGIVASTENFGVQAEAPSHPELLDWLAADFVESGWDIKRLLRKMVSSAAYQQTHAIDLERLRSDPANRLLSRGPRVRLQAEMIRDQALFLSGLLVERLGGPSHWVYQPAGLWKEIDKRGTFVQDHGEKLYRRSLYSRVRRTVPSPGMRIFDMPSREMCAVSRPRTNTPLQALALMNEVTYVEAARKFAERVLARDGHDPERIAWAFRSATSRRPLEAELSILVDGYRRRLAVYREHQDWAVQLLRQGEAEASAEFDKAELAAMATVTSLLLNLDEVINR